MQGEHHFYVEGKCEVRRWVRIPEGLFRELEAVRVEGNPYVFAAYTQQLRRFYERSTRPGTAKLVKDEFDPAGTPTSTFSVNRDCSSPAPVRTSTAGSQRTPASANE